MGINHDDTASAAAMYAHEYHKAVQVSIDLKAEVADLRRKLNEAESLLTCLVNRDQALQSDRDMVAKFILDANNSHEIE